MKLWMILLISILLNLKSVKCIDCFRCKSFDNSNKSCDDPFQNNQTESLLVTNCYTGKRNRDGMFPATSCIKLSGTYKESGKQMVVRDCSLDSGSLNADTELVRVKSQCGAFYLDGDYIEGCVQSCNTDACNSSTNKFDFLKSLILYISSVSILKSLSLFKFR